MNIPARAARHPDTAASLCPRRKNAHRFHARWPGAFITDLRLVATYDVHGAAIDQARRRTGDDLIRFR